MFMPCFPCCVFYCSGAEVAALIRRFIQLTGVNAQIEHADINVHEQWLQERENISESLWSEAEIKRQQRRVESCTKAKSTLSSGQTHWSTSPSSDDKDSSESDSVASCIDPKPSLTTPSQKATPKPPPKGFEKPRFGEHVHLSLRNPCFCCRPEEGLGKNIFDTPQGWPKACLAKPSEPSSKCVLPIASAPVL